MCSLVKRICRNEDQTQFEHIVEPLAGQGLGCVHQHACAEHYCKDHIPLPESLARFVLLLQEVPSSQTPDYGKQHGECVVLLAYSTDLAAISGGQLSEREDATGVHVTVAPEVPH